MANRLKFLNDSCRKVLTDRAFTDSQINKLTPRLHEDYLRKPKLLAEIIDRWNLLMGNAVVTDEHLENDDETQTPVAAPPRKSLMARPKINMNTILAEIEPDLLLFEPDKLLQRHRKIQGLGLMNDMGEHWTVLFNAPRGFYLQDWVELMKKIYYVEQNLIDLLWDKKDQRDMKVHPLVKSAAVVEADFDHIRTRYLFALRTGYKVLNQMFKVQTASDKVSLGDIILSDNSSFLDKFSPCCSSEEYNCFANLIKRHEIDEDDADVYNQLAELESIKHPTTDRHKDM